MSGNGNVITRRFELTNKYGLHARPSSMLVKAASKYDAEINVIKGDITSNAKSIMELMLLAAAPGEVLTVVADGEDAEAAIAEIETLFVGKFGEIDEN